MGEAITLKYHFHLQKVGRLYLAITTGDEARQYPRVRYFNESGAEILRLLQEHTSADTGVCDTAAVLDALASLYDAPREELRQCLEEVLRGLEPDVLDRKR